MSISRDLLKNVMDHVVDFNINIPDREIKPVERKPDLEKYCVHVWHKYDVQCRKCGKPVNEILGG